MEKREEEGKDGSSTKINRLKGMKIRDEFLCPITYELMREPVVAMDGHTYEKSAIEKWLKSNQTSPRSGEPMDTITIPNMNLKKLIQDIINEGGAGFYTNDISNRDRLVEVCPERILILECLGPSDSDWNQQSFQVGKYGCVGGRKHNPEDAYNSREIVLFKDITVSRRHFEITQSPDPSGKSKNFYIRDLGSAGGTFIRIMFGTRKQLHPGMIILIGKHQFTVSSIDDGGSDNPSSLTNSSRRIAPNSALRKSGLNSDVILSLVENAEKIIADISKDNSNPEEKKQKDELSARLKSLTMELSSHLTLDDNNPDGDEKHYADAKGAFQSHNLGDTVSQGLSHKAIEDKGEAKELLRTKNPLDTIPESKGGGAEFIDEEGKDDAHKGNYSTRRCTLTCCAPDGSPLQGKSFIIDRIGATLGRKHTNAVPLFMKIIDSSGEERIANVDTAISSEHARVEFDEKSGQFYISDGTVTKPSTNGTWFRLSGPHQESPPHLLHSGAEVLIGTVRFQVRETMTISERKVSDEV
mmetsp:Transcript_26977/g.29416  ORF Transcript_26977/g.29416 Transcript_26977/m.29416 type:complete len:526 (-) Transcript_26977:546-2123(-)